jgi:hypothetical protein
MAQLNANNNIWSVSAASQEEALLVINGFNNCLAHPDLDTPEKIAAWIAEQEANSDEEGDEA